MSKLLERFSKIWMLKEAVILIIGTVYIFVSALGDVNGGGWLLFILFGMLFVISPGIAIYIGIIIAYFGSFSQNNKLKLRLISWLLYLIAEAGLGIAICSFLFKYDNPKILYILITGVGTLLITLINVFTLLRIYKDKKNGEGILE